MKKHGRTLRKDGSIVLRGIKEFRRILPGQMKQLFIRSILIAILPFITTAVSAYIMEALLVETDQKLLFALCFLGVGTVYSLTLWKNRKDCRIAVGFNRLFSSHELALTNKSYKMQYEELEKNSTRALRDQVSGSISVSGAGMASLYWDIEVIFKNTIIVLIAIAISATFVVKILLWDMAVNDTCWNTVKMVAGILVLVILCSFVTCKMTSKRFDVGFDVFENGSKYIRYGDFYTMNYLSDENAAMDARIYQQNSLITSECQSKCYEHFAEGKRKECNAVSCYDGTMLACSCVCGCVVYALVGQKAMQGAIGVGSILMMYAAVTMMIQALSDISEIVTDLRNNNEHLLRYFKYMDLPEEESFKASEKMESCSSIVFENVSFTYPESEVEVLHHINLEIKAGDKLAIVGENGSGKTTLIKLLCRLYRPTEGRILFNGKDIWDFPYEEYIASVSTVFQDFSLFAFSLAANIATSLEYDEEKLNNAICEAGLSGKVKKLEKGVLQPLFHYFEEDGTDLSGGEAQKVAIARAIYKDADLMILDEPTSALDPYAEYEIYKKFSEITSNKTVLSISHRLSSCRMCDKIIVMDQGKMIQYGSHTDLLEEKEKKYYEMWMAQAQYYMK